MNGLRKWGGFLIVFFGLIQTLTGLLSLIGGEEMIGFSLFSIAFGAFLITVGYRLAHKGMKAMEVEVRQGRLDSIREQAAAAPSGGGGGGAREEVSVRPDQIRTLGAMARDGRLPLSPVDAGFACSHCGVEAETRQAKITENTGLILFRNTRVVEGRLCRTCIIGTVTRFNAHNRKYGWWGPISFFVTMAALSDNSDHRKAALRMAPPREGLGPPRLTPAVLACLGPVSGAIAEAFIRGTDPKVVCEVVAGKFGVTPGEALLFAASLAAQDPGS